MCQAIDGDTLIEAIKTADLVISVEEHAPYGGLGADVASVVSKNHPVKVIQLALPDDHVITGKSQEVFDYYGLNAEGIVNTVKVNL